MASIVMSSIKVQSRIKAIQHKIEEDHCMRAVRREEYVLSRFTEESQIAGSASIRIRALELLGKTVSMFSEKLKVNNKNIDRTSEEIEKNLIIKLKSLLINN